VAPLADADELEAPADAPVTAGHVFGEITFLLASTKIFAPIPVGELPALVLPAVRRKQFQIFRDGRNPIGAALWAQTDAAGAGKLALGWRNASLSDAEWSAGNQLWLAAIIAPGASAENRQFEVMVADLMVGAFGGRDFWMAPHQSSQTPVHVEANAGQELINRLKQQLSRLN